MSSVKLASEITRPSVADHDGNSSHLVLQKQTLLPSTSSAVAMLILAVFLLCMWLRGCFFFKPKPRSISLYLVRHGWTLLLRALPKSTLQRRGISLVGGEQTLPFFSTHGETLRDTLFRVRAVESLSRQSGSRCGTVVSNPASKRPQVPRVQRTVTSIASLRITRTGSRLT